jgi:hypothetical protein
MGLNQYGKVSWTLKDGRWVRPETGEVDSRELPPRDWSAPVRVNVGSRPKKGEKPYKPSEDLLRSLNNSQRAMEEAERAKFRAALEQRARDIDAGKIIVDPDVTVATPVVRVDEGDKTRYVRADRMDPAQKERIDRAREASQEEARRKQAAEIAARMKERGTVASDLAAVGRPLPAPGVFITEEGGSQLPLLPAQPDASTRGVDRVDFITNWTPMRNPGKKFI